MENVPSILVVEDEVLILHMIESALKGGGFKVESAASSERAIQKLDAQESAFCAIVMDVNLGRGVNGWDVARHAREINHAIAVIYVTGHGADEWSTHGLPASVVIEKPFAIAQLVTAVASLVNGGSNQRQG